MNAKENEELARLREQGERFDVVIVDPPAFIKRRREIRAGEQDRLEGSHRTPLEERGLQAGEIRDVQARTAIVEPVRWGHDEQGTEMAAARANALRFSNDEIQRLRLVIRHHMRVHFHSNRMESENKTPSRKAIYRFFRDADEAGVDLLLLALADTRATRGHTLTQETWAATLDICRIFLENFWEKPAETIAPPRHHLQRFLRMAKAIF